MAPHDATLMHWLNERMTAHERTVGDAVQSLVDKVDDVNRTLIEHVATEDAARKELDDFRAKFRGNGKPGYDTRLDRIEQWKNRIQWVGTSIVVPAALYGIYAIFQHLLASL